MSVIVHVQYLKFYLISERLWDQFRVVMSRVGVELGHVEVHRSVGLVAESGVDDLLHEGHVLGHVLAHPRQAVGRKDVEGVLGPNSIEQFWPEFWLEKPLRVLA